MADSSIGDGVPAALAFLRTARQDPEVKIRLAELDPQDGLEPVLALAAEAGYPIGAETLRRAHQLDWQLRRARYA